MTTGWETKPLGEVCRLVNGRTYKKDELLRAGKYPVLRVGNFFTNRNWYYSDLELSDDQYCDSGDLLYAWSASFGPRLWDGDRSIFHYHIWKVIPNAELIDKHFLFRWFEWDAKRIKEEHGAGSTMMHVSKRSMDARKLELPPLEEQKRIVAILDAGFADIDLAESLVARCQLEAADLLQECIDDSVARPRDGYQSVTLGKILSVQPRNGWSPPAQFHSDSGTPVLTLSSVTGFQYDGTRVKFTSAETTPAAHYWVEPGDVLITRSNTPRLVGHVAICDRVTEPTIYPDLIMRCRVDDSIADARFIYWSLRTRRAREYMTTSSGGASQTMSKITKAVVQNLPLSIPNIVEQRRIAVRIDDVNEALEHLLVGFTKKMALLADLRQSLLHQAFSGQL